MDADLKLTLYLGAILVGLIAVILHCGSEIRADRRMIRDLIAKMDESKRC
jgi:hypothetical protein